MFSWATEQFDKISNTLAPPPTDAPSRFVYCALRDDEAGAAACVPELHGAGAIVHAPKGQVPLHVACQSSMANLIRTLMQQPGASLDMRDGAGNTPIHCACMSKKPNALDVVKMLVTEYKADVTVKNNEGKTPYDVCEVGGIRQYLLPLQLQRETQDAIDRGGAGLPPGIDLGGLRIKNSALPPPPSSGSFPGMPPPPGGGSGLPAMPPPPTSNPQQPPPVTPSAASAPPDESPMFATPTPGHHQVKYAAETTTQLPAAPILGPRDYALTGSSSAAIYRSARGIQPDGFHSSSSDKRLQQKYGHSTVDSSGRAIPPPPKSGDSLSGIGNSPGGLHPVSAPPSLNAYRNPYSAGASLSATRPIVDPVTGQTRAAPASGSTSSYGYASPYGVPGVTPPAAAPNYMMFNPAAPSPSTSAASAPVAAGGSQYQTPYAAQQPPSQQRNPTTFASPPAPTFQRPPAGTGAPMVERQAFTSRTASGESAARIFSSPSTDGDSRNEVTGDSKPVPENGTDSAKKVFGSAPTSAQQTATEPPREQGQQLASDMFAMPPSAVSSSSASPSTKISSQGTEKEVPTSNVTGSFGVKPSDNPAQSDAKFTSAAQNTETSEELTDVPLSPDVKNTTKNPSDPALYSAIGMPPPPFSRK